jgi:hypothetical protein
MAARVFKVEFRVAVAQRILNGETVSSLSSQYKIRRSVLYRWRDAYHEKGKAGFGQPRGPRPGAKRNAMAEPFRGQVFSGTDGQCVGEKLLHYRGRGWYWLSRFVIL